MSAVLRVYGDSLDVDEILSKTTLSPCAVQRRGELRFPESPKIQDVFSTNAVYIEVSNADFSDLSHQVEDAVQFLELCADDVSLLATSQGVEEAIIDFGIAKRDVVAQVDIIPARLIRLAGRLNLGLSLSQYLISEPD